MGVFKCKMCGGDIELSLDKTFGTCECCGSQMTFPKFEDEQKLSMFNRGNAFRIAGEFDKALALYENIVREDDTDAEAHWCCALCRFGIEYVEDPATFEYIPTCHRASFESFLEDIDYKAAVENADGITKKQYQKDAIKIADVQRGILATSQNEEPFDVFICYKENDDVTGQRTKDSVDAQEIYYQLTNEGYRVFFSRITLEGKAGTEYEPYIFAALNSAKVMVVVGSKPEYFNAVWVKNEWSRFLAIMRKDRSKLLLPCYRNMDPYDLPEQLSVLQSYDMTKIGFMQDLIRGIKKITAVDEPKAVVKETVVVNNTPSNSNVAPLLERVFMFLEDGKWAEADEYCEKVLDIDPKNVEAYLGKLMAELHVTNRKKLADCAEPFDDRDNFAKVIRFGDEALEKEMREYITHINERNENTRLTGIYNNANNAMNAANTESAFKAAADMFATIPGFKDADALAEQCLDKAEICKQERLAKEEADRLEAERKAEERRVAAEKAAKKRKKAFAIGTPIVAVCIAFLIVLTTVILPNIRFNNLKSGNFNVGDTVKFGNYHSSDEWIVLDKQENRMLLISKYAIDCQPYNTSYIDVTWESCSLRKWLNDMFLKEAFNDIEQALISTSEVTADANPNFSTNPGNGTTDRVFLLSITEAKKYFTTDESRKCAPTAYAKAQGAWTSDSNETASGEATCWWWLRSPDFYQNFAADVDYGGSVDVSGHTVIHDYGCVRPALWINLDS